MYITLFNVTDLSVTYTHVSQKMTDLNVTYTHFFQKCLTLM